MFPQLVELGELSMGGLRQEKRPGALSGTCWRGGICAEAHTLCKRLERLDRTQTPVARPRCRRHRDVRLIFKGLPAEGSVNTDIQSSRFLFFRWAWIDLSQLFDVDFPRRFLGL